jgi:two-component system cell cycle sensor histidine kinase/response regulator CckA
VPEREQDRSNSVEAEMDRQADLLQKTFDSMTDAVFILDAKQPTPIITECNQAACAVFGYDRTEMLGRSTQFLHVSDETLKEFQSLLYSAVEEGHLPFHLTEFRMKRKNGTVFPSEHTVSQLKNDKGERIAWVSIVRDITERKRIEEALRESEERYRLLFDESSIGIGLATPDGKIVSANESMQAITGYSAEELKHISLADTYDNPSDRERLLEALKRDGSVINYPLRLMHKDGTRYDALLSVSLVRIGGKDLVQTTCIDITERKQMEDELRRLSQFRESVIDNAHVWLDVLDEKGNVMVWNKAAEAISGYSREEVIGYRKIWEWLYPDEKYRKSITDTVAEVVRSGRIDEDFETTIRRKDGQVRIISWNERSLLDARDKTIGSIAIGRDVTEHKKMEEAIRESEARHRGMLDNMLEGCQIIGFDWRYLYVNDASAGQGRRTKVELLNHTMMEMYPGIENTKMFSVLKECMEMRVPHRMENEFVFPDGTKGWFDLSMQPVPEGVFILSIEITDRKRMQEELRRYSVKLEQLVAERTRELAASKDFAENLIQTANAMVVGLDNSGNVRFVNQATERITGYTSKELEGRDWFEVIVPRDRYPEVWAELERLLAGGLPRNFENPILTKSGEERYIIWQNNVVREQDQAAGTISFGIDITKRKQVEEQLHAARQRLEYVISSNPAVIYTAKVLADLSDWELTFLSENVIGMLGYEAREFVGHPEFWGRHVHPEDLRSVLDQIPRLWKEGQHAFEYRFLHKDGTYRWIREETEVIRNTDRKPIEVNGYWTDITERKQMEARLAEAQRLAVIGETTAMIGHDLRNPLQGIAGIVYLAKKNLESRKAADREAAADLLDTIEEQVMYMDKIVSDLQDYAQPLAPELSETNLPNLIRQTLSTIKIPETVKVSVKIGKLASSAVIDSTLMRRTLTNLATNAIQAMPRRGRLTIRARSRGDSIILTVEDTGSGIPRKNLPKVFDPFFTTKARGQGLGLSVCKRLVEAQGGAITVKSKPRKGTTFAIKLRRGKKEVAR